MIKRLMLLLWLVTFCVTTVAQAGTHTSGNKQAPVKEKIKKKHHAHHKHKVKSEKKQSVKLKSARHPIVSSADEGSRLALQSNAVFVQDQSTGAVLFEKNSGAVLPIASITKLMTAMVVLDGNLSLDEVLFVDQDDVDTLRSSRSRLSVGTELRREDMLRLALMSSENRAASSLGRHYPGGKRAFVAAMNRKAQQIGLKDTHFADSTGLSANNVSSPRDLAKMVSEATKYPLIRSLSTTPEYQVQVRGHNTEFHNTNMLVHNSSWDIGLSKTGFINEAGKCLVMQVWVANRPTIIVLLHSLGKFTRIADATRIKKWVERTGTSKRRIQQASAG